MRPAGAAGQRRDQARGRGIAVPVERAQVNVPSGATGRTKGHRKCAGPRAPRRSSARTARAFAGIGVRSRRRLGARRPEAPARRSRVWRRPQRQPWLSAQLPSFGGAHGRIVVQTVREAMRSSLSRLASADHTREATREGRNVEKSCERTSEPFLDLIISRSGKTNLAGARICKLERKSARQVCCAAMKPFRRSGVTRYHAFS